MPFPGGGGLASIPPPLHKTRLIRSAILGLSIIEILVKICFTYLVDLSLQVATVTGERRRDTQIDIDPIHPR